MKNKIIFILLIIFSIISILSIYSSTFLLSPSNNDLYIKQIIWYILGFIIIWILYKQKKNFFYRYSNMLYIIGIILLILVLFFGTSTNGSKAWFIIPKVGSFQPSEFMKIILIIKLSDILNSYPHKNSFKQELITILKCIILTLIPALLTFLEPDTGNVIILFVILFFMLFIYGVRYRWFITFITIILVSIGIFLYLYFNKKELFINIFGTNFFYRMDRLLLWKNKDGMQLKNALAAIGSSPSTGYGISKTPIYFPEPHTDFITSIIFSNFGFYFNIIFILLFLVFDILIINIGIKANNKNKYLITGIISTLIFQQIQNIGMNIGLLPITGITLPFISYGGSSLLCYMILIGLIFNINKKTA